MLCVFMNIRYLFHELFVFLPPNPKYLSLEIYFDKMRSNLRFQRLTLLNKMLHYSLLRCARALSAMSEKYFNSRKIKIEYAIMRPKRIHFLQLDALNSSIQSSASTYFEDAPFDSNTH